MKHKKLDYHNMKPKNEILEVLMAYKEGKEHQEDDRWWIGVDLDGTLAHYDGWVSSDHIGEPIPEMLNQVKTWLAQDYRVKIFTARCGVSEQVALIADWLEKHGIGGLEITNVKDYKMMELWDDRCVQVVRNTGQMVIGGFSQIEDEVEKEDCGESSDPHEAERKAQWPHLWPESG